MVLCSSLWGKLLSFCSVCLKPHKEKGMNFIAVTNYKGEWQKQLARIEIIFVDSIVVKGIEKILLASRMSTQPSRAELTSATQGAYVNEWSTGHRVHASRDGHWQGSFVTRASDASRSYFPHAWHPVNVGKREISCLFYLSLQIECWSTSCLGSSTFEYWSRLCTDVVLEDPNSRWGSTWW